MLARPQRKCGDETASAAVAATKTSPAARLSPKCSGTSAPWMPALMAQTIMGTSPRALAGHYTITSPSMSLLWSVQT